MQCFWVVYREISYEWLDFPKYTHEPLISLIDSTLVKYCSSLWWQFGISSRQKNWNQNVQRKIWCDVSSISGSQTSDDILPEKISCRSIKVCRIQRCKVKEFRKDGRIVYQRLAGETSPKPKDCWHNFVLWTDHYGNGNILDTKCWK